MVDLELTMQTSKGCANTIDARSRSLALKKTLLTLSLTPLQCCLDLFSSHGPHSINDPLVRQELSAAYSTVILLMPIPFVYMIFVDRPRASISHAS
jgi:hypothetical protein